MAVRVQFRRGTQSQWDNSTSILAEGELGYATDTGQIRFGKSGGSTWSGSAIAAAGDINAVYAGTGLIYGSLTNAGSTSAGGAATSGSAGTVELKVDPTAVLMSSTITTKGDMVVGTGSATYVRLAKGTNGQFLTVDTSSATSNLAWSNTLTNTVLDSALEQWNVQAARPSTADLNVATSAAWYYTTNTNANWTLNIINLPTMAVEQSITVSAAVTNGATAYYHSALEIEGVAQATVKWNNGLYPNVSGGNANAIDVYTFTILKTAETPTYVVFGSKTKFA